MSELIKYPGSLHNHTHYSNVRILDCIIKEQDLITRAIELGQSVVAITDHELIGNAIKAENIMAKYKESHPDFKLIRGNEIYLCRNGLNNENFNKDNDKYYHFILLAKDLIGFRQICEISTRAWNRSYMSRGMRRVPTYYQDLIDIIGANPGHVIGSTACLGGALPTQILRGTDKSKLNLWIKQMCSIFGKENFVLEMQPSTNTDQIIVNQTLYKMAQEHGLKYIITTDSHYLKKEDREIHKAYLNSKNGDRETDLFYATTYLMDTDDIVSYMKHSFDNQDIINEAFKNIEIIRDMCENYSIKKPTTIPQLQWLPLKHDIETYVTNPLFNKLSALQKFSDSPYYGDKYLVGAVIDGIENKLDLQNDEALEEINLCLEDTWTSSEVNQARWSNYFLNLQHIVAECWNAGTLVGPSRGSGGGFILLYLLDITQINPLKEETKCYRWRFLNPERASVLD